MKIKIIEMATGQEDIGNGFEIEGVDETAQLRERPFNPTLTNIETKTPSLQAMFLTTQK